MGILRYGGNPVITPGMVKPSNPCYTVKGAFNPGACEYNGQIILLLRVAETCQQKDKRHVSVPVINVVNGEGYPDVFEVDLVDPMVSLKDTRGVVYKGRDYLSTLSHIRIARSWDGHNFTVDPRPFIFPSSENEQFGIEDARVTFIDGHYYVTYTIVSTEGWATALARTRDFIHLERLGTIFLPENKDVSIFPKKLNGKYFALNRPNNSGFGKPSIWCSESPDLLHWGKYRCIMTPRENIWENLKIGGGAPSVLTQEGWLHIYHGKGEGQVYSLFAALLDKDDPSRVLKRGKNPLIKPETSYEKDGFFGNVVFSNGLVKRDNGTLLIYYGACDEFTCVAETTVDEVLGSL